MKQLEQVKNWDTQVSTKQMLGVLCLGLSVFLAVGGHLSLVPAVTGWVGATTGGSIAIHIQDQDGLPISGVEGVIRSILYMGHNVTLNAPLEPSDKNGDMNPSISLDCTARVELSHPDYMPYTFFTSVRHGEAETETISLAPVEVETELTESEQTDPSPNNTDNSTHTVAPNIPETGTGTLDKETGEIRPELGLSWENLMYAAVPAFLGVGLIAIDTGERRR